MSDRTFRILRILLLSLLIVGGTTTLLAWLAVSVHQSVLLSGAGRELVSTACEGRGGACRGLTALMPFLLHTVARLAPFGWYALLSAVVLGGFVLREGLGSGEWRLRVRVTPLALILGFLASVWLLHTVHGLGSNAGTPYARIVEPLPSVYAGASPEGLAALQENVDRLQERGCLAEIGQMEGGARVYDVKQRCIQSAFFTRVLPHALLLLGLFFVFLTLGRALLRLLRLPVLHPLAALLFSLGLGAAGLIVLLWALALAGAYTPLAGWVLLLLLPVLLFRDAWYWLRSLWQRGWNVDVPWHHASIIVFWLLLSLLALNYVTVIRPFPIGWDDLGKYINQPRMLVSYGAMTPAMGTFLWEYLTSLGFLLFGFGNVFEGEVFGATFAMIINWGAGLLAVLTVYAFGRLYLGPGRGLLAALLYYALPMVGHFSFADMKVDNAVFSMASLAVLAAFHALFPPGAQPEEDTETDEEPTQAPDLRWLVLAGILGGVAFAMKPTSLMTLMALGTVLLGIGVHWSAFLGAMALAWVVFGVQGTLNIAAISQRIYGDPSALNRPILLGALLVIGGALTAFAFYLRPDRIKPVLVAVGVFIASFAACIAPWLLWNNLSHGTFPPRLTFSTANAFTPSFVIDPRDEVRDIGQEIRRLPEELQVDRSQCVETGSVEELDRYWGYRTGWSHYLTLPWRTVMNADSAGYYVTTFPALLLFPLVLLLPFAWRRRGRWLLWLTLATFFMIAQWMLFANGILWYGLGMFLGIVIGLEALVARAPDPWSRWAASLFLALSLVSAFAMRAWQYEQQRNLLEYPLGKASAQVIAARTIPDYEEIRESVERRHVTLPDRPYTYRIGTFIPYFIRRNIETLPVSDSQLDLFNCLHQERDPALTLQRLQALGFNGIIFDTNAHTIEADPQGSLHRKVQAFIDFVNTPGLGIDVAVYNPEGGIAYIRLP